MPIALSDSEGCGTKILTVTVRGVGKAIFLTAQPKFMTSMKAFVIRSPNHPETPHEQSKRDHPAAQVINAS